MQRLERLLEYKLNQSKEQKEKDDKLANRVNHASQNAINFTKRRQEELRNKNYESFKRAKE